MAPRCCGQTLNSRHRQVLAGLTAAGIPLPDGAQVWGANGDDGWAWRIVDGYGQEPDPPIRATSSLRHPEEALAEATARYHNLPK